MASIGPIEKCNAWDYIHFQCCHWLSSSISKNDLEFLWTRILSWTSWPAWEPKRARSSWPAPPSATGSPSSTPRETCPDLLQSEDRRGSPINRFVAVLLWFKTAQKSCFKPQNKFVYPFWVKILRANKHSDDSIRRKRLVAKLYCWGTARYLYCA